MRTFLLSSVLIFCMAVPVHVALAGGCLPGEPCDEKLPVAKKEMPAEVLAPVTPPPAAESQRVGISPNYVTLGAGWTFVEKDEEILGHQAYEARFGFYHFAERLSFELGVGILPDVRNREYPDPGRFRLDDDTSGVRLLGDLLIHFDKDGDIKEFDPYFSVGGGTNLYDDSLQYGKSAPFAAVGVGAFVDISERWFVKPDYRLAVVDENTEINHYAMVAIGFRFPDCSI